MCIKVLFSLCWRDIRRRPKQASVVEQRRLFDNAMVDPSERGHFQILHVAPRALAVNQLGFEQAADRLGAGVAIQVADPAARWFDALLCPTPDVSRV